MAAPDPARLEADLLQWLGREIFDPSVQLGPETDLIGAGFDSMSLVRLFLFVEESYGAQIPEAEITEEVLADVRSLAAFIAQCLDGVT